MLEIAYLNQTALKEIYTRSIIREEFKYYFLEPYFEYELSIEPTEWRRIQYVSKNEKGEILGYLGAFTNRVHNHIENVELINLTGRANIIFSKDLVSFMELLLCKRQFRKIIVKILALNPSVPMYKKFIIGNNIGQFIGTLKDHCLLHDGHYYDMAIFEIYKENFEAWLKRK